MPKPVKKKKKFIHKKESTTYRLIPGYVNDEDASAKIQETSEETEARKEEQRNYGIFFDDAYNYMKHVRNINEQATLVESFYVEPDFDAQSNSSRQPAFLEHFSTDVREEDDIDPEVLEALDNAPLVNIAEDDIIDKDVPENDEFLDDDFIAAAGGPVPAKHTVEEDDSDSDFIIDDEEDENTDEQEDGEPGVSIEVSSDDEDVHPSQRRGNMQDDIAEAQTALILKNFEEGLGFRYSSHLSDDERETPTAVDYENLKQILKDDAEKPMTWSEFLDDVTERPKIDVSKYLYEDEEEYEWTEVADRKPKFDCMSVLSLHSNTRNLPTDILPPKTEPKRNRQSSDGDSENSNVSGINFKQLQAEMRENRRVDKACTFRPKDETVDEKKARKKAIKDDRKERRHEKKANREVFALEKEKMKKETAALSKSVKSIQIL